ncbi:hypothetical protein BASA81_003116 [Batrachochytrium salamandrivorans]|nr:hypothetical protein BASA81_003116 [Batrachochytrium salamandrivorans]
MKIYRMVVDYALLFFVPVGVATYYFKDERETTLKQIENTPAARIAKQKEKQLLNFILTQNDEKEKLIDELSKKGT